MTKKEWTIIGVLAAGVLVVFCLLAIILVTATPGFNLPQVSVPKIPTSRPPTEVSCTNVDVRDFLKAPERYRGLCIGFIGKIFNIEESGGTTFLQMYIKNVGGEYSSNAVAASCPGTFPGIYEQDEVAVAGIGAGMFEGTNTFGAKISQPLITGCQMKKVK